MVDWCNLQSQTAKGSYIWHAKEVPELNRQTPKVFLQWFLLLSFTTFLVPGMGGKTNCSVYQCWRAGRIFIYNKLVPRHKYTWLNTQWNTEHFTIYHFSKLLRFLSDFEILSHWISRLLDRHLMCCIFRLSNYPKADPVLPTNLSQNPQTNLSVTSLATNREQKNFWNNTFMLAN